MTRLGNFLFLSLGLVMMFSLSQSANGDDKNESGIKGTVQAKEAKADGSQELILTLDIPSPFHIYANPVGLEDLESVQTKVAVMVGKGKPKELKVNYPKGKLVKDPLVGDHSIYEGKVEIPIKLVREDKTESITIQVKYQACDDKRCLPPATMKLILK